MQAKRKVGIDLVPKERKISVGQFHVVGKMQTMSRLNLEIDMNETSLRSCSRDFLRVYYSDYLGVTQAKGPKFLDEEETRLEYEEWIKWMQETNPRSRMDAYPMLLICKELLRRLARKEIHIISKRTDELLADLKMAESTSQSQQQELVLLRGELQVGTALSQVEDRSCSWLVSFLFMSARDSTGTTADNPVTWWRCRRRLC